MAGVSNFGQQVAGYAGSFVLAPFGLDAIDGRCDENCCVQACPCDTGCDDFSSMWKLSLLGSTLPMLNILLNNLLVPNFAMTSGIQVDPVTKRLTEIPLKTADSRNNDEKLHQGVGRTKRRRDHNRAGGGPERVRYESVAQVLNGSAHGGGFGEAESDTEETTGLLYRSSARQSSSSSSDMMLQTVTSHTPPSTPPPSPKSSNWTTP